MGASHTIRITFWAVQELEGGEAASWNFNAFYLEGLTSTGPRPLTH